MLSATDQPPVPGTGTKVKKIERLPKLASWKYLATAFSPLSKSHGTNAAKDSMECATSGILDRSGRKLISANIG